MRTFLWDFSVEVGRCLDPVLRAISGATGEMEGSPAPALACPAVLRSRLDGVRERLVRLREDLGAASSRVAVFGPPRSGKTLLAVAWTGAMPAGRLEEAGVDLAEVGAGDEVTAPVAAVYVAREDALLYGPVRDEIAALLERFGHLHVVANLDGRRRDVGPDGSVVERPEGDDAEAVVRSFREAVDGSSVAAALADGRLSFHAIDLLAEASRRLASRAGAPSPRIDATLDGIARRLDEAPATRALVASTRDRALGLLAQARAVAPHGPKSLEREAAAVREEEAAVRRALDAAAAASALDAVGATRGLRGAMEAAVAQVVEEAVGRARGAVPALVERWFAADDSLAGLLREAVPALVAVAQRTVEPAVAAALRARTTDGAGGGTFPEEVRAALEALHVPLDAVAREARERVESETDALACAPAVGPVAIAGDVPVKRTWLDRVTLRGDAARRRSLFGAPARPDRAVASGVKAERLGYGGRVHLEEKIDAYLAATLPRRVGQAIETVVAAYARAFGDAVRERVERARAEAGERRAALWTRREALDVVRGRWAALAAAAGDAAAAVAALAPDVSPPGGDAALAGAGDPAASEPAAAPEPGASAMRSQSRDEAVEAAPAEEEASAWTRPGVPSAWRASRFTVTPRTPATR
jgi:hypothetical protein